MILREEFLFVTLIHISITGADSPSSGTFYPLEFLQCNCKWWVNETARGRSQNGMLVQRSERASGVVPAPRYLTTLWLSRPTCLKWMRATWRLQLGMKPHSLRANSLFVKCQSYRIIRENIQCLVTSQHKSKVKMPRTELWIWKIKDLSTRVYSPFTTKLLAATWVSAQSKDMRAKVTFGLQLKPRKLHHLLPNPKLAKPKVGCGGVGSWVVGTRTVVVAAYLGHLLRAPITTLLRHFIILIIIITIFMRVNQMPKLS